MSGSHTAKENVIEIDREFDNRNWLRPRKRPEVTDNIAKIIRRRGNKWCLLSRRTGQSLGCYDTKAGAEERERQVSYFRERGKSMLKCILASSFRKLYGEKVKASEVAKLCPKCALYMAKNSWSEISVDVLAESLAKQARDPEAVCGSLWFNGTEKQREAFGSGTEGLGTDERPPKAWFDDCVDKVSKSESSFGKHKLEGGKWVPTPGEEGGEGGTNPEDRYEKLPSGKLKTPKKDIKVHRVTLHPSGAVSFPDPDTSTRRKLRGVSEEQMRLLSESETEAIRFHIENFG